MPATNVFDYRRLRRAILFPLCVLPAILLLTSCSGSTPPAGGAPAADGKADAKADGKADGKGAAPATPGADPAAAPGGRRGGGGGGRGGRGGRGDAGGAVPAITAKVQQVELPLTVQGVGNVEAFSTVEVRSQVTGPLLSVEFTEGQDVKDGQLLFVIDPRPFETALKQAQATLARDTATVENSEAVLKRNEQLFASGLMSRADHDSFMANVKSQRETLNVDTALVDNAKLQLANTRITAPIPGRTGALAVHKGSLVRVGDQLPMVVINQITPVRVTFSLPARYLPQIRAGQTKGALQTEALASGDTGSRPSKGSLTFIDNTVDASTASIKLKATFPNTDRALWPGEFVQARLRLSVEAKALVIPAGAVQNGTQGQFVWVVGANRSVATRQVKVARSDGGNVVISEGLEAGEEVVTDGQLRLTPGARISVRPAGGGQ